MSSRALAHGILPSNPACTHQEFDCRSEVVNHPDSSYCNLDFNLCHLISLFRGLLKVMASDVLPEPAPTLMKMKCQTQYIFGALPEEIKVIIFKCVIVSSPSFREFGFIADSRIEGSRRQHIQKPSASLKIPSQTAPPAFPLDDKAQDL